MRLALMLTALLAAVASPSTTQAHEKDYPGYNVENGAPRRHIPSRHKPIHVINVPSLADDGTFRIVENVVVSDAVPVHQVAGAKHKDHANHKTPIGTEMASQPIPYRPVIDKVGHGIAPDQPPALPVQYVTSTRESVETWVKTAQGWVKENITNHEPTELAIVGACVLAMAVLVIAIARQQQRAYEEEQEASQSTESQPAEPTDDLEAGDDTTVTDTLPETSEESATDGSTNGNTSPTNASEECV